MTRGVAISIDRPSAERLIQDLFQPVQPDETRFRPNDRHSILPSDVPSPAPANMLDSERFHSLKISPEEKLVVDAHFSRIASGERSSFAAAGRDTDPEVIKAVKALIITANDNLSKQGKESFLSDIQISELLEEEVPGAKFELALMKFQLRFGLDEEGKLHDFRYESGPNVKGGLKQDGILGVWTLTALQLAAGEQVEFAERSHALEVVRGGSWYKNNENNLASSNVTTRAEHRDATSPITHSHNRHSDHGYHARENLGPLSPMDMRLLGIEPDFNLQEAIGYRDGQPITVHIQKIGMSHDNKPVYLRYDAAQAFLLMNEEFQSIYGRNLPLNEGFRTMEEQKDRYAAFVSKVPGANPANRPGTSNHQEALALDMNLKSDPDANRFLRQRGRAYGFIRHNNPQESHHLDWDRDAMSSETFAAIQDRFGSEVFSRS